jgi:hypothetical protein
MSVWPNAVVAPVLALSAMLFCRGRRVPAAVLALAGLAAAVLVARAQGWLGTVGGWLW